MIYYKDIYEDAQKIKDIVTLEDDLISEVGEDDDGSPQFNDTEPLVNRREKRKTHAPAWVRDYDTFNGTFIK